MDEHLFPDALDGLGRPQNSTAQRVAVAVQNLGRAVEHVIGTQGQGLLQGGTGPGGIDGQEGAGSVGQSCQGRHVCDANNGVGRRLDVHEAGVGPQSRPHLLQVAGVHQADLDAPTGQVQAEQLDRARIAHLAGHDVVPLAQQGQEQRRHSRHAAGQGNAAHSPLPGLQGHQPVLQSTHRRVAPAGVRVRWTLRRHEQGVEQAPAKARQLVGGRHVQRQPQGTRLGIWLLAGVNGQGVGRLIAGSVVLLGH